MLLIEFTCSVLYKCYQISNFSSCDYWFYFLSSKRCYDIVFKSKTVIVGGFFLKTTSITILKLRGDVCSIWSLLVHANPKKVCVSTFNTVTNFKKIITVYNMCKHRLNWKNKYKRLFDSNYLVRLRHTYNTQPLILKQIIHSSSMSLSIGPLMNNTNIRFRTKIILICLHIYFVFYVV